MSDLAKKCAERIRSNGLVSGYCCNNPHAAEDALAAFIEAAQALSVALSTCGDLFSEIRGDWSRRARQWRR